MDETAMSLKDRIRQDHLAPEADIIARLVGQAGLSRQDRETISRNAAQLVRTVRETTDPTMMESFLAEYGLSTREGIALMCLAEALLRVPDAGTIDALIEDKIVPGRWGRHLGQSSSSLVNASTWALMLTGKVIAPGDEGGLTVALQSMVKRLGEPVVRTAVSQAMRELGRQFVLGRTIEEAVERAAELEERGYTYSYDMLGEAARTDADARRYHLSYSDAITALSPACRSDDIRRNPGISVKLSALHARYEFPQHDRVMSELVARARSLAMLAKSANMGFNIDAEESERLDLSLDVIEAVLSDPALAGWDGFGVVVQAFGQRASGVIDWLHDLACRLDRKVMVRLVKGAYWDTEIKRAQVLGTSGFPVFTRKVSSDVSFIACARKLLSMTDRVYPQFATHNAHSVASVLQIADDKQAFEFQRLHGMGEALHDTVMANEQTACRIYAPVGAHQDLLAYLVRRLLENGANSSFVNQIVDETIPPEEIAADPFEAIEQLDGDLANPAIVRPQNLFGEHRPNARGWDIFNADDVAGIESGRQPFAKHRWQAGPLVDADISGACSAEIINPACPEDIVGHAVQASREDVDKAIERAQAGFKDWSGTSAAARAACLRRAADLYERDACEFFALAAREAGKTLLDCIGEVREAVDFARYYACEAERNAGAGTPRGLISCISPWNFPLAIFSGQVLAALAAGNAVLAKPAEQTPLIAAKAVSLMHEAGIPRAAIQLLPGDGPDVGAALVSDPRISGVCFTGSTQTAQIINRAMAEHLPPDAPLIAETGGINAMIVDSTALPEQAVRDVLASAFQSAGQRCSALRLLYVQEDVAGRLLEMLQGAMEELRIGDPWALSTDIGPVIDQAARSDIKAHCQKWQSRGRLMKQLDEPETGLFVPPTLIQLDGIDDLEREVFGPVLHVATFKAEDLDTVVNKVNATGYGLTFGLHTRMDSRVQKIVDRVHAGNIYVNRNQIGAVVGSQPFGGEGLSGTGPKAGGPFYVRRFMQKTRPQPAHSREAPRITATQVQNAADALDASHWATDPGRHARVADAFGQNAACMREIADTELDLPGPTGESNRLSLYPRGVILCLGPDQNATVTQAATALAAGNACVVAAPQIGEAFMDAVHAGLPVCVLHGTLEPADLAALSGIDAVAFSGGSEQLQAVRTALAQREGPLIQLITGSDGPERYILERHVCVDTTAAGGNATLLAAASE